MMEVRILHCPNLRQDHSNLNDHWQDSACLCAHACVHSVCACMCAHVQHAYLSDIVKICAAMRGSQLSSSKTTRSVETEMDPLAKSTGFNFEKVR